MWAELNPMRELAVALQPPDMDIGIGYPAAQLGPSDQNASHTSPRSKHVIGFWRLALELLSDPINDVLCDPVEYGTAQEINIRRSARGAAASLRHPRLNGLHDGIRQAVSTIGDPGCYIEEPGRHQ
jgi:hypothetical protein